jgi:Carboxypeptidase regulatory-like domain/TonB-dependent Receptor Plug Domain
MLRRLAVVSLLFVPSIYTQTVDVCCSVTVSVRTAGGQAVPRVAIRVESGAMKYDAESDDNGDATVRLRTPGQYHATATADGYTSETKQFNIARDDKVRVELTLVRRDSVTVKDRVSPLEQNADALEVTRDQIRSLPERVADVRNALPLIPGVVRTPEGRLQISGTPEYRSTFLVNSIDITNPATGSFGATVPIDVIETMQVYKSPFLAEYGHFSSAVVAVSTRRGGEKWHYELNDPTPEMRIRSGHIVGIRGFTPRFATTGPLVRNKLFFAGAGSFELRKRPVYPLPYPFNEEKSQRINAYTQFDYVPRGNHFVSVSLHGVLQRSNFVGLNFYTPQPAAPSWRAQEYRGAISDRIEKEAGVFESVFSIADLNSRTAGQGLESLAFTPTTTLGNYFFTQDRRARRTQFLETWTLRSRKGWGTHALKTGVTIARTTLDGSAMARDFRIISLAGEELAGLTFRNQGAYRLTNWDGGIFVQDGWEPFSTLRIDGGLRVDLDHLAHAVNAAPRIGVAWTPVEGGRTVFRGGVGWFYDRVPMNVFSFPYYPERFGFRNVLIRGDSLAPRSRTASVAIDHRFNKVLLLHAGYLQSNYSEFLVVRPQIGATELSASGYSRTREAEFTTKLTWYPEQQWVISYVHTSGRGNINNFDRFLGDFPEPLIRQDVVAPLPGIVPHRFLSWGVFPLPYGLRFSPVFEWRSGFPYTLLNEYQGYAGLPNTQSMPQFLSFDVGVSKDIVVRRHKVRVSFSMFNVTDHGNYDAVRLNTADPQVGEVLGRRPRRYRLDFDWLF